MALELEVGKTYISRFGSEIYITDKLNQGTTGYLQGYRYVGGLWGQYYTDDGLTYTDGSYGHNDLIREKEKPSPENQKKMDAYFQSEYMPPESNQDHPTSKLEDNDMPVVRGNGVFVVRNSPLDFTSKFYQDADLVIHEGVVIKNDLKRTTEDILKSGYWLAENHKNENYFKEVSEASTTQDTKDMSTDTSLNLDSSVTKFWEKYQSIYILPAEVEYNALSLNEKHNATLIIVDGVVKKNRYSLSTEELKSLGMYVTSNITSELSDVLEEEEQPKSNDETRGTLNLEVNKFYRNRKGVKVLITKSKRFVKTISGELNTSLTLFEDSNGNSYLPNGSFTAVVMDTQASNLDLVSESTLREPNHVNPNNVPSFDEVSKQDHPILNLAVGNFYRNKRGYKILISSGRGELYPHTLPHGLSLIRFTDTAGRSYECDGTCISPENDKGRNLVSEATPYEATWIDPDQVPELSDEFFETAEIRNGDEVIRPGLSPIQTTIYKSSLEKLRNACMTHNEAVEFLRPWTDRIRSLRATIETKTVPSSFDEVSEQYRNFKKEVPEDSAETFSPQRGTRRHSGWEVNYLAPYVNLELKVGKSYVDKAGVVITIDRCVVIPTGRQGAHPSTVGD